MKFYSSSVTPFFRKISSLCAGDHPRFFFFSILLLFLLKLWISQYEDTKISAAMHDDAWFVYKASHQYWNIDEYNELSYIKEPLFPLYIFFMKSAGVPLRLGNDIVYGLSLFVFALLFRKCTKNELVSIAFYALLLFHPYSNAVFTRSVSDALYSILMVGFLAPLPVLISHSSKKSNSLLAWWSFNGGLMCITRPEAFWVFFVLTVIFACKVYMILERFQLVFNTRAFLKELAAIILLVFLPCVSVVQTVKIYNWKSAGFYSVAEQSEPHYQGALKALMSVKPETELRYSWVQMETLRNLSEHSPAIAEVYEKLSGPIGKRWSSYAHPAFSPGQGELGGHFPWAFREAVGSLGYYQSPISAQNYYEQISNEVNDLLDRGIFQSRHIYTTGIGPKFSFYDKYFFSAIKRIFMRSVILEFVKTQDDETSQTDLKDLYKIMTLRKSVSYQSSSHENDRLSVRGWLFCEEIPQEINSIVGLKDGRSIKISAEVQRRHDVLAVKSPDLIEIADPMYGYRISLENPESYEGILFKFDSGNELLIPIENFMQAKNGSHFRIHNSSELDFLVWLDEVGFSAANKQKIDVYSFDKFQAILTKLYPYFLALSLITLLTYFWFHRRTISRKIFILAIALASIPFSRYMVFVVIDMAAFPGDSFRYMFPISIGLYSLPFLIYSTAKVVTLPTNRLPRSPTRLEQLKEDITILE